MIYVRPGENPQLAGAAAVLRSGGGCRAVARLSRPAAPPLRGAPPASQRSSREQRLITT